MLIFFALIFFFQRRERRTQRFRRKSLVIFCDGSLSHFLCVNLFFSAEKGERRVAAEVCCNSQRHLFISFSLRSLAQSKENARFRIKSLVIFCDASLSHFLCVNSLIKSVSDIL